MRIIEGPRTKIKILVSDHNLKEYQFNRTKNYHQVKTEKIHQCPIYFKIRFLCAFFEPSG